MKAIPNLYETVISNWIDGEIRNINKCKNYTPVLKGYMWYECNKCGLKTKFNIPDNLGNPTEVIAGETIITKKVPKKIFCPACMLKLEPKRRYGNGDLAAKAVGKDCGMLEQTPELNEFDAENKPIEKDNFFLAVFNEKVGVPIYREFEELLKNGKQ